MLNTEPNAIYVRWDLTFLPSPSGSWFISMWSPNHYSVEQMVSRYRWSLILIKATVNLLNPCLTRWNLSSQTTKISAHFSQGFSIFLLCKTYLCQFNEIFFWVFYSTSVTSSVHYLHGHCLSYCSCMLSPSICNNIILVIFQKKGKSLHILILVCCHVFLPVLGTTVRYTLIVLPLGSSHCYEGSPNVFNHAKGKSLQLWIFNNVLLLSTGSCVGSRWSYDTDCFLWIDDTGFNSLCF